MPKVLSIINHKGLGISYRRLLKAKCARCNKMAWEIFKKSNVGLYGERPLYYVDNKDVKWLNEQMDAYNNRDFLINAYDSGHFEFLGLEANALGEGVLLCYNCLYEAYDQACWEQGFFSAIDYSYMTCDVKGCSGKSVCKCCNVESNCKHTTENHYEWKDDPNAEAEFERIRDNYEHNCVKEGLTDFIYDNCSSVTDSHITPWFKRY